MCDSPSKRIAPFVKLYPRVKFQMGLDVPGTAPTADILEVGIQYVRWSFRYKTEHQARPVPP